MPRKANVAPQKILERFWLFITRIEKIESKENNTPPPIIRNKDSIISPRAVKKPIKAPNNALQKAVNIIGGFGGMYLNSDI